MEKYIDLHTHSTTSDGTMSPRDLVVHAVQSGLSAIALTDHDTVEGNNEAIQAGKDAGIIVVPGVEISVDYEGEMHILGYFVDSNSDELSTLLSQLRQHREKRNPIIVDKLLQLGMNISMQDVENEVGGEVIGRVHIARALVAKGYVKSVDDAFDKLLASGRPGYTVREKLTPKQGIRAIKNAGGIAVLAHPFFLGLGFDELDRVLAHLKSIGLRGIEAIYSNHSQVDTGNLLRLAIKHDMLVTGGSDFHGTNKPEILIGRGRGNLKIKHELLDKLMAEI